MPEILLINPNTSQATTEMMVAIAAAALPPGFKVVGATAAAGSPMIVNEREMAAAADGVVRTWRRCAGPWDGVIVSAFGDPGIAGVRAEATVPVVGIFESSLCEAAAGGRHFGVATVTPDLAELIRRGIEALGLGPAYRGIRLTPGDPRALAADPQALAQALAEAVRLSIEADGADAVVIGGGPLGQAACQLQAGASRPVIAPIPSAARALLRQLDGRRPAGC